MTNNIRHGFRIANIFRSTVVFYFLNFYFELCILFLELKTVELN